MKVKYSFIVIFFSLIAFSIHENAAGQAVSKTDSLHRVINDLKDSPEKADNLLALSLHFYSLSKLDSALVYCDKAYALASKIGYQNVIAESVYRKGMIQNRSSNYRAAISSFRDYLDMVKSMNESKKIAKAYYNLGTQLKNQGNFDSAMYCYHQSLSFCRMEPDTFLLLGISNAIGTTFLEITSQYDSATIYYLEAVKLCKASGNERILGLLYNNLGKAFQLIGENEKAMEYLELAVEYNRKVNDIRALALAYTIIGAVYTSKAEYDKAIENYDLAMELLKPFGEVREVFDLYHNYASIYQYQGKFQIAIEYYSKVVKYSSEQKLTELMLSALRNIGVIYSKQGKFATADALYDSSLQIANSKGFRKSRMNLLDAKYNNYFRWGEYKKAFEWQSEYYSLKDSLFDIEKTKLVNELTIKYEKGQDQARILALENENLEKDLDLKKQTLQRNTFLYAGITILVLAVFLFLYFRQRRVNDRIITEQKIQRLEEEKKLMAAKLLVEGQENERKRIATELHDGLGVLLSATKMQFSTIADQSPGNKDLIQKAIKMLEQASGDVRKISHNMMPGLLTKLGFYEAVEDLFEHVDDTGKIKASCIIVGNQTRLSENREIMLYRIIQEMVNNSLKHAEASNISLQVKVLPDLLNIIYADDGKGFDLEQKLESESIGLKSIQSRVNFLNGNFNIETKPGEGVKYILQIPV
jgi:two-component system, NarL family, sensor kinase